MAYLALNNFKAGLDTRRSELSSLPGTLLELNNAHVNQGGECEKRKAFVKSALNPGTFGMLPTETEILIFGSLASPASLLSGAIWTGTAVTINITATSLLPIIGQRMTLSGCNNTQFNGLVFTVSSITPLFGNYELMGVSTITNPNGTSSSSNLLGNAQLTFPSPFVYQQLIHPNGTTAMSGVASATLFSGNAFVAAEFADGNTFCYYNGTLIPDFLAGLVTSWSNTDAEIASAIGTLINATGSSLVSGEPEYTAQVNGDVVDVFSTPTVVSGTPYSVAVTTTLQAGSTGAISSVLSNTGIASTPATQAVGSFTITAGLTATQATGSVTFTNNANNNDTVTIAGVVYTFVNTLTNSIANQIKIGANTTATSLNFTEALMGTGTPGTNYSSATTGSTTVTAIASTNVTNLTAVVGGTPGNSITLATSDSSNITLSGANLSGGTNNNYVSNVNVGATNLLSANVPYNQSTSQTAIDIANNINANNTGFSAQANTGVVTIYSPTANSNFYNGEAVEVIAVGQVIIQQMSFIVVSAGSNSGAVGPITVGGGSDVMNSVVITYQSSGHGSETLSQFCTRIATQIAGFSGTSGYTAVAVGTTVYISPLTSTSATTPGTLVITDSGTISLSAGTFANLMVVLSSYTLTYTPGPHPSSAITATASGGNPPYTYKWAYAGSTHSQLVAISPTSATTQWATHGSTGTTNEPWTCTITDSASPTPNVAVSQTLNIFIT